MEFVHDQMLDGRAFCILMGLAARREAQLHAYTRSGKLTDNGLIESFNGRLCDEFLNVNEFVTMQDAREK